MSDHIVGNIQLGKGLSAATALALDLKRENERLRKEKSELLDILRTIATGTDTVKTLQGLAAQAVNKFAHTDRGIS